jgi:hypothetical protein
MYFLGFVIANLCKRAIAGRLTLISCVFRGLTQGHPCPRTRSSSAIATSSLCLSAILLWFVEVFADHSLDEGAPTSAELLGDLVIVALLLKRWTIPSSVTVLTTTRKAMQRVNGAIVEFCNQNLIEEAWSRLSGCSHGAIPIANYE